MNKAKKEFISPKLGNYLKSLVFWLAIAGAAIFQPLQRIYTTKSFSEVDNNILVVILLFTIILTVYNIIRIIIGTNFKHLNLLIIIFLISYFSNLELAFFLPISIYSISIIFKILLKLFNLHQISKNVIVISSTLISVLGILLFFTETDLSNQIGVLLAFPLSIEINNLIGKQLSVKEFMENLTLIFLFISVSIFFCYLGGKAIGNSQILLIKKTILAFPDLLFAFIAINVLVGSYSGLRLIELIRFRKILFK